MCRPQIQSQELIVVALASEAKSLQVHLSHGSMPLLQPGEESGITPVKAGCVCVRVCVFEGSGTLGKTDWNHCPPLHAHPTQGSSSFAKPAPRLPHCTLIPIQPTFWLCLAVSACWTPGPRIPFSMPITCTPHSGHESLLIQGMSEGAGSTHPTAVIQATAGTMPDH